MIMPKRYSRVSTTDTEPVAAVSSKQRIRRRFRNPTSVAGSKFDIVQTLRFPFPIFLLVSTVLYLAIGAGVILYLEDGTKYGYPLTIHGAPDGYVNVTEPSTETSSIATLTPPEKLICISMEQFETLEGVRSMSALHRALRNIGANHTLISTDEIMSQTSDKMLLHLSKNDADKNYIPEAINSSTASPNDISMPRKPVDWSFGAAFVYTFSIVTTIGYGYLTPRTIPGQVFTLIYAIFGIPLGYLGLANVGRLLNEGIGHLHRTTITKFRTTRARKYDRSTSYPLCADKANGTVSSGDADNYKPSTVSGGMPYPQVPFGKAGLMGKRPEPAANESPDDRESSMRFTRYFIVILFVLWISVGVCLLPLWEHMTNWEAAYFIVISLTTIGFGDLYPKNYKFFPFTYVYLMFGLVITTMMIDLCADYLRKLQYFGRKLKRLGAQYIWIGSRRITIKSLIVNVAKQMPVSEDDIDDLINNLDKYVDNVVENSIPAKLIIELEPVRPECFKSVGNDESIPYCDDDSMYD